MSEEEIKIMFEVLKEQYGDTDNYVNDLLSYANNLQQELNKKNKIIEEIKEYITSEESIDNFKTIESREEWLKINKKLLEQLEKGSEE